MSIRKTDMIYLRVTPQERKRIEEKMAELGIHNMSAYIRKMALDGLCICLDLKDIRSLTEQVARCGNNLNQYAKRTNENGSIYVADIMDLQEQFHVSLDYLLLGETESNSKAKRDILTVIENLTRIAREL